MPDYLAQYQSKHHLTLGDRPLCPVTRYSAGLLLDYPGRFSACESAKWKAFLMIGSLAERFVLRISCLLLLNRIYESLHSPADLPDLYSNISIPGSVVRFCGVEYSLRGNGKVVSLQFRGSKVTRSTGILSGACNTGPGALNTLDHFRENTSNHYQENDLNCLSGFKESDMVNFSKVNDRRIS
ncbi:hypothetical protein [Dyadobacter sp. CY312]|uniref:hypothetical protein n=1 Tax=Dyadobacter sp. CY312 TaxID=2907303 RepID=UPI001F34223A|nr:hypothetical protein [Dyadobacter sp. CY312]MCE7044057.1 hypothetical protein [Dyadobacter sp. CY312]